MRRKEQVEEAATAKLIIGQKRKHSDLDAADPRLKEFLEVMQPASKANNWATQPLEDAAIEPPTKIQAIELPDAESDEEYEMVPKKPRNSSQEPSISIGRHRWLVYPMVLSQTRRLLPNQWLLMQQTTTG